MRALIPLATVALVGFLASRSASSCSSSPGEPFDASGAGLPGSCMASQARTIPLGDCTGCNELAYALCQDGTFSQCACDLPSGYTVVVGGYDGG